MKQFSKYVGLDVHKEKISVSVADRGDGEVRYLGEILNTTEALGKVVKQLRKNDESLTFCYEAGLHLSSETTFARIFAEIQSFL